MAGPNYKEVDAGKLLSNWYGPESTVCHTFKQINETEAQAQFVVGANLCGPLARPPMFDCLTFSDGVFRTQTDKQDANQHFIESVGVSVIPGHNIFGLTIEALMRERGRGKLYVVGFDSLLFRRFTIPGQPISISSGTLSSFTMEGQKRPFTVNFRVEAGADLYEGIEVLDQHWLLEAAAQGAGMFSMNRTTKGLVPVLLGASRSTFAKAPVLAGDTLTTYLSVISADKNELSVNAKVNAGNTLVADIQELLLQFVPIDEIRQAVERAQKKWLQQ